MIKSSNTLQQASINPYISWAYADQDLKKMVKNSLVNPNFLVWQRYNNDNNEIEITYSDLIQYNGYTADCWYLKNYQFGSQSILITKEESLFKNTTKLTNSIKIASGDQEVSPIGLNVALSQNIESDKIFNLLDRPASVSFFVKSSIRGTFTCTLIIFDNEREKKYIINKPFFIKEAHIAQKVVISFGSLTFPGLTLNRRAVSAELDISISGSSSSSDQSWNIYDKFEAVITCLNNQTNLFTGNNDYIQISNIGLQNGQPGHIIYPEYNSINYIDDLSECQEFFERLFIDYIPIYYKYTDNVYSNWFSYYEMKSIKRNQNPTITVVARENKLKYQPGEQIEEADIAALTDLTVVRNLGSLYTQKTIHFNIQSSVINTSSILYSYCNNLILDVS